MLTSTTLLLCSYAGIAETNNPTTLAAQRLSKILERQQFFLNNASKPNRRLDQDELTRRAQEIVTSFESYLNDNERDVNALILYGKFLRKMDQSRQATGLFLEAEKIDPRLAVIKQHIGNYLVEEGRLADALPYLLKATQLEPKQPIYHHQLGTFLFLFGEDLVTLGIASFETNSKSMHQAFRAASKLAPNNFEYKLRFAQSFFDVPNPNWSEALQTWQKLRAQARERPLQEREYLAIGEAKTLSELRREEEAKVILKTITSPALRKTRENIIKGLDQKQKKKSGVHQNSDAPAKKHSRKANLEELPEKFIDNNLRRLRQVSSRLREEKLLSKMQVDVIRASYDKRGEVRISLSRLVDPSHPKRQSPETIIRNL